MSVAVVRVAESAEDMDAVRDLFRAYGRHLAANPSGAAEICLENFEAEIASLPGVYSLVLLAMLDEQPAGCVALKHLALNRERACELKRLWVAQAYRGHRLGKRLVEAAIAQAALDGYTALYLDTVPAAMPEANRLYDALGFERVDRYNNNSVADITFFRLALPCARAGI